MKKFAGILGLAVVLLASNIDTSFAQQKENRDNNRANTQQNRNSSNNNLGRVERNDVSYKRASKKVVSTPKAPSNSDRIINGNKTYQYTNGKFYLETGGKYVQVPPTKGVKVKHIPNNYKKVSFNNILYYFLDGIFYNQRNGYYEVVTPQIGTIVNALPSDYEKVNYKGNIYYEYNGVLFDKLRNGKGYLVVGDLY